MDQLDLLKKIYPLNRNIISDGFDEALEILSNKFPLKIHKYPTGLPCWTWKIPPKWTCKEGYIQRINGERVVDYTDNPLFVASYSNSIDQTLSRDELLKKVHTHPYLEDAPPFIFYYYNQDWGFCLPQNLLDTMTDPQYKVVIRAQKEAGTLKMAEYHLPGRSDDCFVISSHIDHPAQLNDGLSGVITGLAVMSELSKIPHRKYSYKLLIGAETIGSIAWLSQNEYYIPKIKGGIFLDMTGINIAPGLQLSYQGQTEFDKLFSHIHKGAEEGAWIADYRFLVGNDERQFNAPGVRIPMLSYARAHPWGHAHRPYKEYHSSKDNFDIISSDILEKSKSTILKMIRALESNYIPVNLFKGEVFLSGYGIAVDRHKNLNIHRNMLKIMDMIDGTNSLADIAIKLNLDFFEVADFIRKLADNYLVTK